MKPEFAKYLQQDSILLLEGETKKQVFEDIVQHAATRCTMDEDQIRDAVWTHPCAGLDDACKLIYCVKALFHIGDRLYIRAYLPAVT